MRYSARGAIRLADGEIAEARQLHTGSDDIVEARRRFSHSTEEYLADCEAATECSVDPRIARYMRSLAASFPPSLILVAQEPYTADLLPTYASAFAFNPTGLDGFTASVQVFAQYLSAVGGVEACSIADLLTCSYVLAPHGIFCINALMWRDLPQCPRRRTLSLFSHYISLLLECTGVSKAERLEIVCLGEVASSAIRAAVKSTSRPRLQGARVFLTFLANPAFIARSRTALREHAERLPSETCVAVHGNHLHLACAGPTTTPHRLRPWQQYSRYAVLLLGNPGPLRRAFTWISRVGLDTLGQQSISALVQSPDLLEADMSKQADESSKLNATHAHIHRAMNSLLSTGKGIEERMVKAIEELTARADLLSLRDDASIKEYLRCLDDTVNSLNAALGFYASINPALTGCTTAVDLVGPSVPPIVRTRRLDDAVLQPISFADALGDPPVIDEAAHMDLEEKAPSEHYEPMQDPEDVAPSEFASRTGLQSVETAKPQPRQQTQPAKRSYVIPLPKRRM
uniref:AlNc14C654G12340 protein n=1 Tax=Albugo laibachii Nc14 TaxID=890382 RepID=F0X1M8_9STRA|nr:AlNc14C654G12340 [Albugo laibachii Nc14]|eukprot:CCA27724.1 AlNc14C654G12340 [Albugo laibachii Nc14]